MEMLTKRKHHVLWLVRRGRCVIRRQGPSPHLSRHRLLAYSPRQHSQ